MEFLLIILSFGRFTGAADLDYDIQGNIYVVDRAGNMLVKYSPQGDSLRAVSGLGSDNLQFDEPVAVVARQGNDIYVADMNNHRVQRFNRELDYITTIYTRDDPDERTRFGYPRDIAVTREGDLLVVDGENRRIARFNQIGRFVRTFGDNAAGAGRLTDPRLIEVDEENNSYVLDRDRLLMFDRFGTYVRDIPFPPYIVPYTIAIDRDTLVMADSFSVSFYSLKDRAYVYTTGLQSPVVAMQVNEGSILAVEEKRGVMYPRRPEE